MAHFETRIGCDHCFEKTIPVVFIEKLDTMPTIIGGNPADAPHRRAYPHEIGPSLDCADDIGSPAVSDRHLSADFACIQHMDVRVGKRWIQ
jgi:hypothetical protein